VSGSGLHVLRERSHLILGVIRLFNGAVALASSDTAARRLGTDPEANPAAIYPLRMFGVRTVFLGAELLVGDEATRRRSMKLGIAIHASDTVAAASGGIRGQLPPQVAILTTLISSVNTALAILGSLPPRGRGWRG
jgi:hypothetical protein